MRKFSPLPLGLCIILLTGCFEKKTNHETTSNTIIHFPSQVLIQKSIFSLVPLFEGVRNNQHMEMLCDFIQGENNADDLKNYLTEQQESGLKDEDYALLNGDKSTSQITTCAAYLATSVLVNIDYAQFIESSETEPVEQNDPETRENDLTKVKVNKDKLVKILARQLAIAQANADIFSIIAKNIPKNLTIEETHQIIQQQFTKLSSFYLERINYYYDADLEFSLLEISDEQFAFSSSSGFLFNHTAQGLNLQFEGIDWYGNGKLLGNMYFTPIRYFAEDPVLNNL